MRTFAAAVLVLLGAAACGDGAENAATTTTTITTSTSVSPSTSTSVPERPALGQSCQSPDGFSISYPADWEAVSSCGQFGPAPVAEPAEGTDDRTGVVSAYVDPVPFDEASRSIRGEHSRAASTVDGLRAVRVESESAGGGLYTAGTAMVTWMVDLTVGVDDEPATLFVNAVDILDDVDFDRAVTAMDRMVRSLEVVSEAGGRMDPAVIGEGRP